LKKIIIVLIILVVVSALVYFIYTNSTKAEIFIGGNKITTVKNKTVAEKITSEIKKEYEVKYKKDISFTKEIKIIRGGTSKTISKEKAEKLIRLELKPAISSTAVIADGVPSCGLPNKEEAGKLLSMAKERFNPSDGNVIEEPEFKENIIINETLLDPEIYFKNAEDAFAYLFENKKKYKENDYYEVKKGDTASHIAKKHQMKISLLKELNPSANIVKIKPGDRILVKKDIEFKPPFTVIVRKEIEKVEIVPYKTTKVSSAALHSGKSKVLFSGKNGKKKTKYAVLYENGKKVSSEIIEENYITLPIDRQIAVGIKAFIP